MSESETLFGLGLQQDQLFYDESTSSKRIYAVWRQRRPWWTCGFIRSFLERAARDEALEGVSLHM